MAGKSHIFYQLTKLSNHLLAKLGGIVSYGLPVERPSLRNEPTVVVVHINNLSLPNVWLSIYFQILELNLLLFSTILHVLQVVPSEFQKPPLLIKAVLELLRH